MRRRGFLIAFCVFIIPLMAGAVTLTSNSTVTGGASVLGTLSKGSGTFVIDHPLDPENTLLYHSFVESPDVKNIYDGIVELDSRGEAVVYLPEYFLALNRDFRYLATPIDQQMPNLHLLRGVRREWFVGPLTFRLSGGVPGGRVSWQITGIRKDPFIEKYPIRIEREKSESEPVAPGECIFEPLCK